MQTFLSIKCIFFSTYSCNLLIKSTWFKFVHALNFPLLGSMGMFYNEFGPMENERIKSYDGHS